MAWSEKNAGVVRKCNAHLSVVGKLDDFGLMEDSTLFIKSYDALSAVGRDTQAAKEMVTPALNSLRLKMTESEATSDKALCTSACKFLTNMTYYPEASDTILDGPYEVVINSKTGEKEKKPTKQLVEQINNMIISNNDDPKFQLLGLNIYMNLVLGSKKVREKMKERGIDKFCDLIIETTISIEVKTICTTIKQEMEKTPTIVYKSMNVFEDQDSSSFKMTRDLRNFLIAGTLLTNWTKSGKSTRYLSANPDLTVLTISNPDKKKGAEKIQVFNLRSVDRGRCTVLLRKKMLGK